MGQSTPTVPTPPSTKQVAKQQWRATLKYMPKLLEKEFQAQRKYQPEYLDLAHELLPEQAKLQERQAAYASKLNMKLSSQGAKDNLKLLNRYGKRHLNANAREARKLTGEQLNLYKRFGGQIAKAERQQMENLDPKAFANRERAGQDILNELKLGTQLSAGEQREFEQSVRAGQAARGNTLGNAAITSEVMTKGKAGEDRYQQRIANAMAFGNTLMQPSQRPGIAEIKSGRAAVPTGALPASLAQYSQGSGGMGQPAGMQFYNREMLPQADPIGNYNANVAVRRANAAGKSNPLMTIGSQAASGASFGSMFGPYGTAIGGIAGAGLGTIQAFA